MSQAAENHRTEPALSLKAIVAIVVGIVALVFVFQNTGTGRIQLFLWDVNAPAWLWLIILFGAGVVVGSLFPWLRRRR